MLDARRRKAALLGLLALAVTTPSRAATPTDTPGASSSPRASERTELVLRIEGTLGQERESALTGLLGSELASSRVTLRVERSSLPFLGWTAAGRREPAALVLAILDVRDEASWALYVVDAARGRAILRRLPGGAEANAAVLEEVSAILASAVAAVREGLEVASKPVEAVVSDRPEAAPPPAAEGRTAVPPPRRATPPRVDEGATRRASSAPRPFVAVLARGSTLASELAPGLAAEAGVRLGAHLGVALHGALDRVARVSTPLGEIELRRSLAALEAGYALALGPLMLEPRLGSGVELIRRSGTTSSPGVTGTPGERHARFAAFAAVRARYPFAGPLAVELGADATVSPQPLRFTSAGTVLASVPAASIGALAGVVLLAP